MCSFCIQWSKIGIRDGDLSSRVECNDWREVEKMEDDG